MNIGALIYFSDAIIMYFCQLLHDALAFIINTDNTQNNQSQDTGFSIPEKPLFTQEIRQIVSYYSAWPWIDQKVTMVTLSCPETLHFTNTHFIKHLFIFVGDKVINQMYQ